MQQSEVIKAPKRRSRRELSGPGQKLLSKAQVTALVGVGYTTIYGWMLEDKFPLAVELGPSGGRSAMIAWHTHEIHQWIESRPRRKLASMNFAASDARLMRRL